MSSFAVAVALWQSAEQRCREVEAADAASLARLVRGVCCCQVARSTPLLSLYWSHVCCCCGGGVVRRVRVLESCEVPRCATLVSSLLRVVAVSSLLRVVAVLSWRFCRGVAVAVHPLERLRL